MFTAARRRVLPPTRILTRQVHATALLSYPRFRGPRGPRTEDSDEDYDIDFIPDFEDDDATSAAHLIIQQQRQILQYLRLIERDAPRLRALRRPFVPPSDSTPVIVRAISYAGEDHPAINKRVIVAPVSKLPLRSPEAIHKLKLLSGPRWTARPPSDSGIGFEEDRSIGEHGYVKISCEDFPEPAMNLKWGSDVLDTLLQEANNTTETFADIPHDQRHLAAKARKHRKGEHYHGRFGHRPTIKDFPQAWLSPRRDLASASTPSLEPVPHGVY
ncbi:hypothetical protein K439DRAFT_1626578 [Ramaria rubella]|nr:hypothetical protein K439DRAFT_1626578 [Ramaria rubella]